MSATVIHAKTTERALIIWTTTRVLVEGALKERIATKVNEWLGIKD